MRINNDPLISCICIVKDDTWNLEKSIFCFQEQTYRNKELIIISSLEYQKFIKLKNKYSELPQIIFLNSVDSLCDLKKLAIGVNFSSGSYCCIWSGNDWHHPARLEYQYQTVIIKEVTGAVLSYFLIDTGNSSNLYISHKKLWPETIFISKNELEGLENDFQFSDRIKQIINNNSLYFIGDVPNLYIHTCTEDITSVEDLKENYKYWTQLSIKDSSRIQYFLHSPNGRMWNRISEVLDDTLNNPIFIKQDRKVSNYLIPKIIHLTYRTKTIPELYKKTYHSIVSHHPHWEIRIYDDTDAEKVVREEFPELLEIYKSYPSHIQRVDVFRILVVYLYGGFYLDLDMQCLKSLDELCNSSLVLGEEINYLSITPELLPFRFNSEVQVGNYIFGSISKHPFWIDLLKEIIRRSSYEIEHELDVLKSTGPGVLSEVYQKNKNKYSDIRLIENKFKRCHTGCPSVSCHFGNFAAHMHVNGWTWTGRNEGMKPSNKHIAIEEEAIEQAYTIMTERLERLLRADS